MDWIEIVEPKTKHRMFANLKTGECSWDPPLNEPIKRTQENQWWELYDRKTARYYYYNPTSSETVWGKPVGCDIIPLAKLQMLKENTEGSAILDTATTASQSARSTCQHPVNHCKGRKHCEQECCFDQFCGDLSSQLAQCEATKMKGDKNRDFSPARASLVSSSRGRRPFLNSPLAKGSPYTAAHINNALVRTPSPSTSRSASNVNRRNTSPSGLHTGFYSHSSSQSSLGAHSELVSQATQYSIATTITIGASPMHNKPSMIHRSQTSWSKEGLKAPLSTITEKKTKKEALRIFKLLQQYMGDRKSKCTSDYIVVSILDSVKNRTELQDEFFLQIVKQLSDNPRRDSSRKGWEMLGIVLAFTSPVSEEVHRKLIAFVEQHTDHLLDSPELSTSQYARHCIKQLEKKSPTAVVATLEAVRQARYTIFYPQKFGASLEEQMEMQANEFPNLAIPWIELTLMKLILETGGERAEGLFRIATDQDTMHTAVVQLEVWVKPTVKDCHVPANLLKQWFRQLPTPIIPNEMYNQCLISSAHPDICCQLINSLPEISKLTLAALIHLLKRLSEEEVAKYTKMDVSNLAMLMAPNILRCESNDPATIFGNSTREMEFMRTIILHYDTHDISHLIQL